MLKYFLYGVLGAITQIFGYGWILENKLNPKGAILNLIGVIVINILFQAWEELKIR